MPHFQPKLLTRDGYYSALIRDGSANIAQLSGVQTTISDQVKCMYRKILVQWLKTL